MFGVHTKKASSLVEIQPKSAMSSLEDEDSDEILSRVCHEIDQDDRLLNKAQAYHDRANELLDAASFR